MAQPLAATGLKLEGEAVRSEGARRSRESSRPRGSSRESSRRERGASREGSSRGQREHGGGSRERTGRGGRERSGGPREGSSRGRSRGGKEKGRKKLMPSMLQPGEGRTHFRRLMPMLDRILELRMVELRAELERLGLAYGGSKEAMHTKL